MSERGDGPSGGSPVLTALIAGVCSGVAASLVVRLADSEPKANEVPPVSRSSAAETDELLELRREIAALRLEVSQIRLPSGTETSPMPAASALGPDEPASQAQLSAVADTLKRLEVRLDAALPAHIPVPTAQDKAKREVLRPVAETKLSLPVESFLWFTESELLAAYGPPSWIAPFGNAHAWTYSFISADGKTERQVRFEFAGGRVINFNRQ